MDSKLIITDADTYIQEHNEIVCDNRRNLLKVATGVLAGTAAFGIFGLNPALAKQAVTKERNALFKWLTNKKPKMLKDWNGGEWLVCIVGNPQTDYESNYGMGIQRMTADWTQTGDPKEKADLYANGLIPRED